MLVLLTLLLAAPPDPLKVTTPSIDAGEVRIGPSLVRRFAFVNAGAELLTITDVRASCGCITPTLPQRTYRPDDRGELALEINTLSQPAGPNRWTVQVGYRCGDRTGTATLELTAKLVKEWDITPAALVLQGTELRPATIRIVSNDQTRDVPDDLRKRISEVRASSDRLKASLANAGQFNHGALGVASVWWVEIDVRAVEDCPTGQFAESVTITTNHPDYPEIKIPVTIIREPKRRVSALPARATLVAGGSAVVQLRAADGQPVQVEAIEASFPALTTRWAAGPGNYATVRVGLDRSKWHGEPLTGEVRVRVKGETIAIPVSVQAGDD
jgi:hypothetical protein